jgi:hypothetical protein
MTLVDLARGWREQFMATGCTRDARELSERKRILRETRGSMNPHLFVRLLAEGKRPHLITNGTRTICHFAALECWGAFSSLSMLPSASLYVGRDPALAALLRLATLVRDGDVPGHGDTKATAEIWCMRRTARWWIAARSLAWHHGSSLWPAHSTGL